MLNHREKRRVQLLQDATGLGYVKAAQLWESIKGDEVPAIGGELSPELGALSGSIFISYYGGEPAEVSRLDLQVAPAILESWEGQWRNLLEVAEFYIFTEESGAGDIAPRKIPLGSHGPLNARELDIVVGDRRRAMARGWEMVARVYPVLCRSQEEVDSLYKTPWTDYLNVGIVPIVVAPLKERLKIPEINISLELGMSGITMRSAVFSLAIFVENYHGSPMPEKCPWSSHPRDLPLTVFPLGENENGAVKLNIHITPMILLGKMLQLPLKNLILSAVEKEGWAPEILSMELSKVQDPSWGIADIPRAFGVEDVHRRLMELRGELKRRYDYLESIGENNLYDYWKKSSLERGEKNAFEKFLPTMACILNMDSIFSEEGASSNQIPLYRDCQGIVAEIARMGRTVGIHIVGTVDQNLDCSVAQSWNTLPDDRLYSVVLANFDARISLLSARFDEYNLYKNTRLFMFQEFGTDHYYRSYSEHSIASS